MENTDAENLELPPESATAKEPVDKALLLRLIAGAVILVLFAIFAFQNTESVEIDFLSWSFQLSTFLLMVLSAVAGVLIWSVAGAYSRRAKKKRP